MYDLLEDKHFDPFFELAKIAIETVTPAIVGKLLENYNGI